MLGATDEPGGKSGKDLAIRQFDRLSAERLDHVRHQFRLLHAKPQTLDVGDGADRPDAVVDRSGPGIVKRQADKSVRLEAVKYLIADRAVQHLLQMLDGAK